MVRKGLPVKSEEKPELISFDVWFQLLMSTDPAWKKHHREMFRAFMSAKGLRESENKESYDKAFKEF